MRRYEDSGFEPVATGAVLVIAMYLVVGFALSQTAWGRHVYAVGDDAPAARLAGIQVKRLLLSVYTLTGVIVALSAWVLIGRVGAATTSSAVDANLDSVTAVVIGARFLWIFPATHAPRWLIPLQ